MLENYFDRKIMSEVFLPKPQEKSMMSNRDEEKMIAVCMGVAQEVKPKRQTKEELGKEILRLKKIISEQREQNSEIHQMLNEIGIRCRDAERKVASLKQAVASLNGAI
jgi:hypothetical protein